MKKFAINLLWNIMTCLLVALVMNFNPVVTCAAGVSLSAGMSFINMGDTSNFAFAGVLRELWTGELIKNFRHENDWLSRIPSADAYVNNDVIHLADIGADPSVLIDNSSYPIATASRTDTDIALALKKFETTNTKITDDELYALPYDKEGSVITQHREVLEEKTSEYGLISLAPAAVTGNTPIIETTGATSNIVTGRKDLVLDNIRAAKKSLDDLKVPMKGRVLVLCTDHVHSLLALDQTFRDKYYNTVTGRVIPFMGFEIFESVHNPVYTAANAKKAFGATAAGTDRNASVFFYAPRAVKAMGSSKMYMARAEDDPQNRESVVGFRLYHLVIPKKTLGFGAIVSDDTL